MANDINLAALWVPVMPETSKVEPQMKEAGEKGRKAFFQGFTGSGGGGSDSPEQVGRNWAQQLSRSFNATFEGLPMPKAGKEFMESLGAETKTTEKQMESLKNKVRETFGALDDSARKAISAEQQLISITNAYNKAVAEGNTKLANNFYGPSVREAQTKYRAAIDDVQTKQTAFIGSTNKLESATKGASKASVLAAGAMGAFIGILATGAIELATEAFKKLGEAVIDVSKFVLESGEIWENQARQITMYTNTSGEEMARLEVTAMRVFGQIDTKGENLGETVGILGTRFKELSDEQLADLSRRVEELGGRFGNLDVRELVSMFGDFGVTGADATQMLTMLLDKARSANMALPEMITALSGASATLGEMGLTAEQGASMIAGLELQGVNATTTINQLATAQKEFTKQGWTFSEGMKQAGERLEYLVSTGQEAEATEFARTVFGSRRWIDAKIAVDEYNSAIAAQPGLYDSTGAALDQFIEDTQSLGDQWQELKNRAYEALAPLGHLILDKLGGALDKAVEYIENNSEAIVKKVRGIGHTFIEMIPMVKDFTIGAVLSLGILADAINVSLIWPLRQAAAWAQMTVGALTLDWDTFKDGAKNLMKANETLLDPTKYSKMAAGFAKQLGDIELPTDQWHREWDDFMNDVESTELNPKLNPQMPQGVTGLPGGIPGLPGILSGGTPGGPGTPSLLGPNNGGAQPFSPGMLFGPAATGTSPGTWQDLVNPGGPTSKVGGEHWRPTVEAVVAQYGPMLGIKNLGAWVNAIVKQIDTESGGDAGSVNPSDSNGQGGTQVVAGLLNFLESTYNANNIALRPYMDPVGQIAAVLPYVLKEYGMGPDGSPNKIGRGEGFASGGTVCSAGTPMLMPPNAVDTVPLWAQPGEEVVNTKASNKFRPLLKWINAQGLNTGGTVRYSPEFGVGSGTDIRQGAPGFPPWVYGLAANFGLKASTYVGHQDGYGIDWWGPVANMDAFAKALVAGGAMPQVIWMNPSTGQKVGMANGQVVGPGTSQPGYYRDDWAGHTDHVHTRWPPAAYSSGGGDGVYAPGDTSGLYPGMPNQYGGLGVYGAMDWETKARNDKAIREAQERIDDANEAIAEKQRQITELEEKAAAIRNETDVWGRTDPEKIKDADQAVADAKRDLARAIRERDDDQEDYNTTVRKAQEDSMKAPKSSKSGAGQRDPADALWKQLGGGLLGGIAESVGLDMFGKAPWEWGSVKLLASLANWGFGTANAWADHIGQGKTGMTGFQPIPGWDNGSGMFNLFSGAAGSAGINLPNMPNAVPNNPFGVTAGPNINVNPNTGSHGLGLGQAPGPAVSIDNSINVQAPDARVNTITQTMQHEQNRRGAPVMSSMPKPMGS